MTPCTCNNPVSPFRPDFSDMGHPGVNNHFRGVEGGRLWRRVPGTFEWFTEPGNCVWPGCGAEGPCDKHKGER